jgi:hypothetical protein
MEGRGLGGHRPVGEEVGGGGRRPILNWAMAQVRCPTIAASMERLRDGEQPVSESSAEMGG